MKLIISRILGLLKIITNAAPASVASYCAAFQSIVVSFAVIVGGIWAVYEYTATFKSQLAHQDLQSRLDSKIGIDIRLKAQQIEMHNAMKSRLLIVELMLKNTGSQTVVMDFRKPPINIIKLFLGPDPAPIAEKVTEVSRCRYSDTGSIIEASRLDAKVIPPRCEKLLTFIVQVESPGLYAVQFAVPLDNESKKAIVGALNRELGYAVDPDSLWAENTYILVK